MFVRLGNASVERGRDLFVEEFGEEYSWFVLHARGRQEKALSTDLEAMEIDCFLPLIRQARYYGNRKISVELPLFPGYLFLRGSVEEAYRADRTDRVVSIIRVSEQAVLNWELKNLHIALIKNVTLDPYPMFKAGIRVEVRSGPLRGLQGVIESRCRANRLVLQVGMLGSAVSLEVDASLLDPI